MPQLPQDHCWFVKATAILICLDHTNVVQAAPILSALPPLLLLGQPSVVCVRLLRFKREHRLWEAFIKHVSVRRCKVIFNDGMTRPCTWGLVVPVL